MQDYQFDHFEAVEEMWEPIVAQERRIESDDWRSRCVCCGETLDPGRDQLAEVVNRSTGARGVAHVECYLNETDIYEVA